jgi:hypothetical protein
MPQPARYEMAEWPVNGWQPTLAESAYPVLACKPPRLSSMTFIDINESIYQLDHDPAQAVAQKEDGPVLDVPSLES